VVIFLFANLSIKGEKTYLSEKKGEKVSICGVYYYSYIVSGLGGRGQG
jgi:hypothetical protein